MFYEVKENKQPAAKKSNLAIKNIRESHKSDWALVRPNHAKIQSIIDKYELDPETVLNDLLSYMSDSALANFAEDFESDYTDDFESDYTDDE